MNRITVIVVGVLAVILLFVGSSALFTVHQTQQALVLQLGSPKRVIKDPGLNVKLPFVQNVEYYDKRILDLDPPVEQVILEDKKRIDVDSFARYRIVDPLEFKKRAVTSELFRNIYGGRLNAAVRAEVAKVDLAEIVSAERRAVMDRITEELKQQAAEFGIELIDVRIGRTDLPEDISNDVYNRMRSEREREANLLRAEGDELKQRIVAEADRDRTILLAEAEREAQVLRGEGDGERNRILGNAYGQDPEFFSFYRSMQAYREALTKEDTTLVLSPDSEFFRFFGQTIGSGGDRPNE